MEAIILIIIGVGWLIYKLLTDWLAPPAKYDCDMETITKEMIGKNQKECRQVLDKHNVNHWKYKKK